MTMKQLQDVGREQTEPNSSNPRPIADEVLLALVDQAQVEYDRHLVAPLDHRKPDVVVSDLADQVLEGLERMAEVREVLVAFRADRLTATPTTRRVLADAIEHARGPIVDYEKRLADPGEDEPWPVDQYEEDKALVAALEQLAAGLPTATSPVVAVTLTAPEAASLKLGLQYDSLGEHLAGSIQDSGPGSLLHHDGLTPDTVVEWRRFVADFTAALQIGEQLFAPSGGQAVEIHADRSFLLEMLFRLHEDYAALACSPENVASPAEFLTDGVAHFEAIRERVTA